jgi:hypothetical protein
MWSIVSHTQVLILQKQQYSSIAPSCKYYLTWGTVLAQLRKYSFEQPDVLYSFKHLKSAIGTMLGICKLMTLTMHNWLLWTIQFWLWKPKTKESWWHLHKLKICKAPDQLNWKWTSQIITPHVSAVHSTNLDIWGGQLRSNVFKTNNSLVSLNDSIPNNLPWLSVRIFQQCAETAKWRKLHRYMSQNLQLLKRWEVGHGHRKCFRKIVVW